MCYLLSRFINLLLIWRPSYPWSPKTSGLVVLESEVDIKLVVNKTKEGYTTEVRLVKEVSHPCTEDRQKTSIGLSKDHGVKSLRVPSED